jgi:hypothetical protein
MATYLTRVTSGAGRRMLSASAGIHKRGNGGPGVASSITRMSWAMASSAPPPKACPLMAATPMAPIVATRVTMCANCATTVEALPERFCTPERLTSHTCKQPSTQQECTHRQIQPIGKEFTMPHRHKRSALGIALDDIESRRVRCNEIARHSILIIAKNNDVGVCGRV